MNDLNLDKKPGLARGCRLREVEGQDVTLQIPEGQMKMTGAGLEILKLCDGANSLRDILSTLQSKYPPQVHSQIQSDTLTFLRRLNERAVLIFS